MISERVILVILLTILIVVGANGILYLALRRGNEANMVDIARNFFHNARNPWKEEDQALQELSRLVADLNFPKNDDLGDAPSSDGVSPTEPENTHAG